MDSKRLLVALLFSYCIIMSTSISAVEYRVADEHNTTLLKSRLKTINTTLQRCMSFIKTTQKDNTRLTSTPDRNNLRKELTDLRTSMLQSSSHSASIGLILQLLIALITIGVAVAFTASFSLSIVLGFLATLVVMTIVYSAIIFIKFIQDHY